MVYGELVSDVIAVHADNLRLAAVGVKANLRLFCGPGRGWIMSLVAPLQAFIQPLVGSWPPFWLRRRAGPLECPGRLNRHILHLQPGDDVGGQLGPDLERP